MYFKEEIESTNPEARVKYTQLELYIPENVEGEFVTVQRIFTAEVEGGTVIEDTLKTYPIAMADQLLERDGVKFKLNRPAFNYYLSGFNYKLKNLNMGEVEEEDLEPSS